MVGEDFSTYVAVIKVAASPGVLKTVTLGHSASVGVGGPVITIGNSLNIGISVTTGIVSGTEKPIDAPNGYTIDGAVQSDAAINSGNSGGPLLDSRGTVIGVNAQIASESGGFEGVGFAVRINTVRGVVEELLTTGEVVHGYIGVRMFPVGIYKLAAYAGLSKDRFADEYGLSGNGAIVSEVARGGPAAKASVGGEKEEVESVSVPIGDVLTEVEGNPVSSPDDVIEVVTSSEPGDELTLTGTTPGGEARQVGVRVDVRTEVA